MSNDLEFLALVRQSLEASAPGVTADAVLKGNSLMSPHGWAVAVAHLHDGSDRHHDLAVLPDLRIQPNTPVFVDCVVQPTGDPRHATDAWAATSGACMLELFDRRGRFAAHHAPHDPRGVQGWYTIESGTVGVGVDPAESERIQGAVADAAVLHRVADALRPNLMPGLNGVKVFYGGMPGATQCEIRLNGERHEPATAAMAALGLPEPAVFTSVRSFAILLQAPVDGGALQYPAVSLDLSGAAGDELDPEQPGLALAEPYLVAELSAEERSRLLVTDTDAVKVASGIGNFLKVRLPIRLEDGRTLIYLAWVALEAHAIQEVVARAKDGTLPGHRFEGRFCNEIEPWGKELLRARVVMVGRPATHGGAVGFCEIVETQQPLMQQVLHQRWPAELVLGARDPRLRVG